jgi:hypothetical protein
MSHRLCAIPTLQRSVAQLSSIKRAVQLFCRSKHLSLHSSWIHLLLVLLGALLLHHLPPLADPLQNLLPILVELQLVDNDLTRVHADRHGLAVRLLPRDALDVNEIFETVHGGDFAFSAFVGAADNCDFVVFADGD